MKALKYILVAPKKIIAKTVEYKKIPKGYVLLKPIMTGICQGDMRYFFGRRDRKILRERLPMCLLHEGIARFKNKRVAVVPNLPCNKCEYCKKGEENYCPDVRFMSSNYDGMSQTLFIHPSRLVVQVPKTIPDKAAVLLENMSVAYRAIIEAEINKKDRIIVFGSGPIGYILAAMLHYNCNILKKNIFVADIKDSKLRNVDMFAIPVNIRKKKIIQKFTKAFECVGNKASESAINQALEVLKPRGILVLLGVCEEKVPIQTRNIVNKGIAVRGSTRSTKEDFVKTIKFISNKKLQKALSKVIGKEFKMKGIETLMDAFNAADNPKRYGKVVIKW